MDRLGPNGRSCVVRTRLRSPPYAERLIANIWVLRHPFFMRYYYTFYSYEEWGRGYIGRRTCTSPPENDQYFGSYTDDSFNPTEKIILGTYPTLEEASEAEVALHSFFQVDLNPHFVNKAKQTSKGFFFSRLGQNHSAVAGDRNPAKRPEVREKLSQQKQGKNNPQYGLVGERNPFYGKTHTEETKLKIATCAKERNSKNLWWVNPDGVTKFQQFSPGPEWQRGRVYKAEETT